MPARYTHYVVQLRMGTIFRCESKPEINWVNRIPITNWNKINATYICGCRLTEYISFMTVCQSSPKKRSDFTELSWIGPHGYLRALGTLWWLCRGAYQSCEPLICLDTARRISNKNNNMQLLPSPRTCGVVQRLESKQIEYSWNLGGSQRLSRLKRLQRD